MAPATKASCHGYFPVPNLNVPPIAAAPACTICALESHIEEIKGIQAALDSRGGIFKSKMAEPKTENGGMYADHQTWMRKWRGAKIKCCRLVEALERLRDEHPDMMEYWGIDEALYLWELAADECCKVPGYKYVGDAPEEDIALEDTKEVESTASIPIVIPAPKEDISPEDDSGWAIVTHIWKKRSQSWSLPSEDEEEKPGTENTILIELEAIEKSLAQLEAINKILARPQSFSKKPSKALAEAFGDDSDDDDGETRSTTVIKASETSSATPTSTFTPNHEHATHNMPQSESKRMSHLGPRCCKSVIINPEATLIPSDGDQIVTQPHNEHAAAEKRRHRLTWNRRSRRYSPSTWASPDGCEKYDTSCFRVSWMALERSMNRAQNKTEDDVKDNMALTEEAMGLREREKIIKEAQEAYFSGHGHARVSMLHVCWSAQEKKKRSIKKVGKSTEEDSEQNIVGETCGSGDSAESGVYRE
ncbi:hypothetical protein PtrSN002B_000870 [Pyrenophora tritici-repentis]|uniref:Uncharacterized protein n=2 Tax=Pyrenophora tritici-repentis TaxID=45151 RepID=A0A2W1HCZ2_9PLEO|nr:uncharacterized protein PTRG_04637 [Pyrenophora tritici-repentis Pt-1C-BFP]KAA8612602.1 hypothetical protein PtrV1_13171 [Pyrenophora tritici-repentis]EDU47544.1 predicted protein [Pyrenophora tritici-repentis Pt-1C-BFP]KAF7446862.1 hypothetical protein A1F99_083090 [Pyrenophora tritici-repentis]KAF7569137.1 hypothetical protein PtrM4_115520 [Pyrenophora tritici-repentis]KAG9383062.1 hypothetical protein A1F94_006983 [Pyrenophora tritici-repentis]